MQAIKRINHNAAICVDGAGHQLIALGRGIGFVDLPREVSLSDVHRTFYGIDPKYLAFIDEVDPEVLEFAAQLADVATQQLSYELSPNLPVTLADHLQFALKRAREHLMVTLPFSDEVQQLHPVEYRLGELAVHGMKKTFRVRMQPAEAAGIALSIVNSAVAPSERGAREEQITERLFAQVADLVEREMHRTVDRSSFAFARFSTHVRYLLKRVSGDSPLSTDNAELYAVVCEQYPQAAQCAARVDELIQSALGKPLTDEELLYLIIHINRIAPVRKKEPQSDE